LTSAPVRRSGPRNGIVRGVPRMCMRADVDAGSATRNAMFGVAAQGGRRDVGGPASSAAAATAAWTCRSSRTLPISHGSSITGITRSTLATLRYRSAPGRWTADDVEHTVGASNGEPERAGRRRRGQERRRSRRTSPRDFDDAMSRKHVPDRYRGGHWETPRAVAKDRGSAAGRARLPPRSQRAGPADPDAASATHRYNSVGEGAARRSPTTSRSPARADARIPARC